MTSEILNGRLAMVAFTTGLVNEKITGKSLLEQIGLTDHSEQSIFLFTSVALLSSILVLRRVRN